MCCEDRFLVLKDAVAQVGDLPGGRFGAGEIYQPWCESVVREVTEELGETVGQSVTIGQKPLFYFPHFITESGYEALGIAYRADVDSNVRDSIQLSAEHDWSQWVGIGDYDPAALFVDHLLEAVRHFQKIAS